MAHSLVSAMPLSAVIFDWLIDWLTAYSINVSSAHDVMMVEQKTFAYMCVR